MRNLTRLLCLGTGRNHHFPPGQTEEHLLGHLHVQNLYDSSVQTMSEIIITQPRVSQGYRIFLVQSILFGVIYRMNIFGRVGYFWMVRNQTLFIIFVDYSLSLSYHVHCTMYNYYIHTVLD